MIYDCLVIGAGPAGLSAAIYLGRFNRSVLVVDKHTGRSSYAQINENYLGFPEGIPARELRKLGKQQAKKFGATFVTDEILQLTKQKDTFVAQGRDTYYGKTVILATGVVDLFPLFPQMKQYVGKSLFWCITCDGYKARNKRVIIVGHNDEAIVTCLQFLSYTPELTFLLNCDIEQSSISEGRKQQLKDHSIPFIEGVIKRVSGGNGYLKEVILHDGRTLSIDLIFNQQGAVPNSVLAQEIGVRRNEKGYIHIDTEQRTNISFVYAAGDVTNDYSHQIATAVHEGSMAAQAANYDLYQSYQRE